MKTMMTLFGVSFAAALAVGAMTPAHAQPGTAPGFNLGPCPGIPTIYECCDEVSQGTAAECAAHGGACERLFVCGEPF